MDISAGLEKLYQMARSDPAFRKQLAATRASSNALVDFCRIAESRGISISAVDLAFAGEDAYAAMRRSANGGGENSPMLNGEDDYYELFLARLESCEPESI